MLKFGRYAPLGFSFEKFELFEVLRAFEYRVRTPVGLQTVQTVQTKPKVGHIG